MSEPNGRTHEPSLREVVSDLDGFKDVMNERDRRYEDRFKAIDEKTEISLRSSREAISKSDAATEKRFDSVNEFRAQLKDQAATLLPRAEAHAKFGSLDKEIEELRKNFNVGQGKSMGINLVWGILVTLVFIAIALGGLLIKFTGH